MILIQSQQASDLVELRGFEPLTSCMPCLPVPSDGVGLSLVIAGQKATNVWLRRIVSAIAWCSCHLACHWLQVGVSFVTTSAGASWSGPPPPSEADDSCVGASTAYDVQRRLGYEPLLRATSVTSSDTSMAY